MLKGFASLSSRPNDFLHAKLLLRLARVSSLQSSMRKNVQVAKHTPLVEFSRTPVWRFWHSGWSAENLPDVVRVSDESVNTYLGGTFEVVRLSDENFAQFATLPDSVLLAYAEGRLSKNHFSDILRLWLVGTYGGLWLDATVYLARRPRLLEEETFVYSQFPLDHARYGFSRYVGWLLWSQTPSGWFRSANQYFINSWSNSGQRVRDYTLIDLCLEESAAAGAVDGMQLRFESQANAHIVQAAMRQDIGIDNFHRALEEFDVHKLSLQKRDQRPVTKNLSNSPDIRRRCIDALQKRLKN